jgi:hypothetical protein
MHIPANSTQYLYAKMQARPESTPPASASADSAAGQDVPGAPTAQTSAAAMPSPPLPSQPAPAGAPSRQFSSDTLASLIALQTSRPSLADAILS